MKIEKLKSYNIVPGIFRIKSNINYIPYLYFGENLSNFFKVKKSRISVVFKVCNNFSYKSNFKQKFHFCYGNFGKKEIYYERPLARKIRAKLLLKDLERNTKIYVNKSYFRLVKFKVDNLYPPGIHLTDILSTKLLKNGLSHSHSACISIDNKAILIFAPPDTGKTITTFLALKNGFNFISEDITIVDKKYAYSCPLTSTFYHLLVNEKKCEKRTI
ncbi:MAG: hypothetical protein QW038_02325 [Nanopusillaceae archaeon]